MDQEVSKTLGELERKLAELERTLSSIDRDEDPGGVSTPVAEPSSTSRLIDEVVEQADRSVPHTPPILPAEPSRERPEMAGQSRQPNPVAQSLRPPQPPVSVQPPPPQQPPETRSPSAQELLRFRDRLEYTARELTHEYDELLGRLNFAAVPDRHVGPTISFARGAPSRSASA